jgi:hypothetical protein
MRTFNVRIQLLESLQWVAPPRPRAVGKPFSLCEEVGRPAQGLETQNPKLHSSCSYLEMKIDSHHG